MGDLRKLTIEERGRLVRYKKHLDLLNAKLRSAQEEFFAAHDELRDWKESYDGKDYEKLYEIDFRYNLYKYM